MRITQLNQITSTKLKSYPHRLHKSYVQHKTPLWYLLQQRRCSASNVKSYLLILLLWVISCWKQLHTSRTRELPLVQMTGCWWNNVLFRMHTYGIWSYHLSKWQLPNGTVFYWWFTHIAQRAAISLNDRFLMEPSSLDDAHIRYKELQLV